MCPSLLLSMEATTAENLFDIGWLLSHELRTELKPPTADNSLICFLPTTTNHHYKTCDIKLLLSQSSDLSDSRFCHSSSGLAALELPEQPTVNSAADFFVSYVALTDSLAPTSDVITRKGKSLVQYILQAIAWAAPRSYLPAFTDIVAALRTHCVTLMSQWLEVRVVPYWMLTLLHHLCV